MKRRGLLSVLLFLWLPLWLFAANPRILEASKSVIRIINVMQTGEVASGTAFCVNGEGYFLTNAHVVKGAKDLYALRPDDALPTEVVMVDESVDLAVLRIRGMGMKPLVFARHQEIQVTDRVVTIGFPGTMQESPDRPEEFTQVTFNAGIIGKFTKIDLDLSPTTRTLGPVVQHDAAVNHGNSGGPLVNECGQVVGVNVQKALDQPRSLGQILTGDVIQGIYYAIDVRLAKEILKRAGISYLEGNADCSGAERVQVVSEKNASGVPASTDAPSEEEIEKFFYVILLILGLIAVWALAYAFYREKHRANPVQHGENTIIQRMAASGGERNPESTVLLPLNGKGLPPLTVGGREILVGRSRSAGIRIDHPMVSGRHLTIRRIGEGVEVMDLGSTNGTYVNGRKIAPNQPVILHPGDRLSLGTDQVTYRLG